MMKKTTIRQAAIVALALLAGCGSSGEANKAGTVLLASVSSSAVASTSAYDNAVEQLYIAYFGRPADTGGFANFKARLAALSAPTTIQGLAGAYDTNASLRDLIDGFGTSSESTALYS